MKGGREARSGSADGRNAQSGLKWIGRAPTPRGPGYRRTYGETTKHAPEASVKSRSPRGRSRGTEGPTLTDPVGLDFLDWRAREVALGDGLALLSRRPVQPGVEHAA
jgi:hypothetical protein